MTTRPSNRPVSRRSALAGLGVGGLGLTLAAPSRRAIAQEAGGDLAGHPLVGTWAVMSPGGVNPQTHGPDGSVIAAFPPNYVDPVLGLTFQGSALGRWESTGARGGRIAFIQALSDGDGAYVGTFQFEADLDASEDGQSWTGGAPRIVVRDAGNAGIFDQVVPVDPPVTATRVGATIDSVVLPVATPAAGTPAP